MSSTSAISQTRITTPITMLSYKLNDGNSVPWLGYGTGTALYQKEASNEVKTALEFEITHLDTAQVYENEDAIASGLKSAYKFGPQVKPDSHSDSSVR